MKPLKPILIGIKDWWSQYTLDISGVETGEYVPHQLRELVDSGHVSARTWCRHLRTRKYALVGEVLYNNDLATAEEYEAWFPNPRTPRHEEAPERLAQI